MPSRACFWLLTSTLLLTACGNDPAPSDAGGDTDDAGVVDAGVEADSGPSPMDASTADEDAGAPDAGAPDAGPPEAPRVCVAMRGNGPRITAHFGALSRIIEHYGLLWGGAGGSSGSISMFLLESVHANPLLFDCGGGTTCSDREAAARAALLFKSLQGYLQVLAASDESLSFGLLLEVISRVTAGDIAGLLETDPTAAVEALRTILEADDIRALVNPEVIALLTSSPDPAFHARDIVDSLSNAASFSVDDPSVFVRPGIIDFTAFADLLGRIGSFYAALAPADPVRYQQFLTDCATPGRSMSWTEVSALPSGEGTCGDLFSSLLTDYRAAVRATPEAFPSRIDEPVGSTLHSLVATSVLEGDAVMTWTTARDDYVNARAFTFDVDFDDVRLGYFGSAADLALLDANPRGFTDLKTQKLRTLGEVTYREALALSPAEPGLARALEINDTQISAGGWSDLQPTLVLQNLGCDEVIFVTRRGGAGGFTFGVSRLLGATDEDQRALFDLVSTDSSYYVSLQESSGVWCTDWDTPETTDVAGLSADGFGAPFETVAPFFTEGVDPYPNITESTGLPGCTVGVGE